ncbi:ABC transporter ATP-binding protein [Pseudoroseicyclus aestuarii]|uniref:NitT/TauT family transport system ATP-binding protein n=1 Tax=Pseudoroseicyclus aestuarii TaxID=1795041 RepID=A0A318SUJ1_9RHOB|nr:ABC transporter ATP-binding protein [Pseudoroseicyclus aestuarii]PYE85343.1 NitT/TauT family transport system ATP-binding protein [Pseudoroseicyclus aestuarii]
MNAVATPLYPEDRTSAPKTAAADPLITCRSLNKVYKTRSGDAVDALVDLNFDIAKGEFISVVGPSGCGKSTLLKIMAGLLDYTSGDIAISGKAVTGPSPQNGLVFQQPNLLPWKTIAENVYFPVEIQQGRRAVNMTLVRELMSMVGLKGFEGKYPHELSGGMQQRAAIVRALVQDPAVLLMDEPFGALDAMTRDMMNVELLKIWSKHRKTVIFITHSIPEAVFLSDRVIAMTPRPGEIAEIIPIDLPRPRPLDVVNTPEFGAYAKRLRRLLNANEDIAG